MNDTLKEKTNENRKYLLSGIAIGVAAVLILNLFGQTVWQAFFPPQNKVLDPTEKITEILDVLDSRYIENYDTDKLVESMYAGLLSGVGDPYTSYMSKEVLERFKEQTAGKYAGIGVVVSVDTKDNRITVVSPFEGSPGSKAGILPGDKILKINGFDVYGDTYEDAVAMMKGTPGTSVNITLYRDSTGKTFDIDVVREEITMPTVTHKMVGDNIGYLRITNFEGVTYTQFMEAYKDLMNQNIQGLIIDVRNNPGGLLDIVTKITNELVPKGYIVYTEDKNGKKEYIYSDEKRIEIPLAILVNGNSASASEVLSGAVKDMNVGVLVGTKTFGKGLVQGLSTLSDGSAVKVTIAKYYTPSGVCINGEGIVPDYVVEMSDERSAQISALSLEEDVQLSKAVEVVQEKIEVEARR